MEKKCKTFGQNLEQLYSPPNYELFNYNVTTKLAYYFIGSVTIDGTVLSPEDWVGALDEFYPALGLANFTNWQLEEYMKAAAKGEAYLPPDLEVVDDNGSLTIRVKGG